MMEHSGNVHTKQEDDDCASDDENNVPFYVNKNGFPVDDATWERMWKYAAKIYPDAKKQIDGIKDDSNLKEVPPPVVPVFSAQTTVTHCLRAVQSYVNMLNYNHTGTQLFEIKKSRPLAGLMDKAKEMIKESLPIKCLEAVILALYLTSGIAGLDRFPIGFKSVFEGRRYYHVVLGVYHNGRYGTLGISRRPDLMDKPLAFKSVYDLLESFDQAYSKYNHQLKKAKIGGIVSHDRYSQERIRWGVIGVSYTRTNHVERRHKLDRYSRDMRANYVRPTASPCPPKKGASRSSFPREAEGEKDGAHASPRAGNLSRNPYQCRV